MTLYDYRELFIDESQLVRVYVLNNDCEVLYEGAFDEMPSEYDDYIIWSLDNAYKADFDGYLGINVGIDEESEDED